jgi:single-stranded-DNA-specific exonuclease
MALNSNEVLPGIQSLLKVAKSGYIDEDIIGFQLGPRLNAPGRITSADICVKLLLTDSQDEADVLAFEIDALNEQRKLLVNQVLEDFEVVKPEGCIVEYSPFWHQGVIGIAAGRLCEKYNLPVVLLTLKEDGITVTGSARSTDTVNIFDHFSEVKGYLIQFGGHAKAAGLSCELSQIEDLISALRRELAVPTSNAANDTRVDLDLPIDRIGIEFYEQLRQIGPFGEGFARPVFCSIGVDVADFQLVGNGKHTRLNIKNGDNILPAIWWNNDSLPSSLTGSNIIYTIGINRYKGTSTAQLEIIGLEAKSALTEREITIEDRRHLPGTNPPIIAGEGISIFVEGRRPNNDCEFNRYGVKPCETLVLASIPPNLKMLKDIMKRSNCSRLVLAYTKESSAKPLLGRLMGTIKGMLARGGNLAIKDIAVACEETEAAIRTGLLLLEVSGFLQIHVHGEELQVKLLPGKTIKKDSRYYTQLSASEQENRAFRNWLQSVTTNELFGILRQ